jgi:hypothetical protein
MPCHWAVASYEAGVEAAWSPRLAVRFSERTEERKSARTLCRAGSQRNEKCLPVQGWKRSAVRALGSAMQKKTCAARSSRLSSFAAVSHHGSKTSVVGLRIVASWCTQLLGRVAMERRASDCGDD